MPDFVKDAYGYIKENKMQFGACTFFMGTIIQAQLMQSGAFEVYVNGDLEFSKLNSGQMPTFQMADVILRKHGINL